MDIINNESYNLEVVIWIPIMYVLSVAKAPESTKSFSRSNKVLLVNTNRCYVRSATDHTPTE